MAYGGNAATPSSDKRFWVQKVPRAIGLWLDGGTEVRGQVHLLPQTSTGRERVLDVLGAAEPFFVVTNPNGLVLVQKERVVLAELEEPSDAGIPAIGTPGVTLHRVELLVAGVPSKRARVLGTLALDMPPGELRLIDFMNELGAFVPLLTDSGALIVARRFIVTASLAKEVTAVPDAPAEPKAARRRSKKQS